MFRVVAAVGVCLGVSSSLRRSETEQLSGETTSQLKSALSQHVSTLDRKHSDSIFRTLDKAQGSNLTGTLTTIIGDLNTAANDVKGHVTSTSNEVKRLVDLFYDNASAVKSAKDVAEDFDEDWNDCLTRLKENTTNLNTAKGALGTAHGNRESAETDAESKKDISASLHLDTYSCDASDHSRDCDNEWIIWKNSTNRNVSSLDTVTLNAIQAYETANDTWTTNIGLYNNALQAMKNSQTTWNTNRGTCNSLHTTRKNKICDWFGLWKKKCAAKQAYDTLLLDVEGSNNVWSQSDRDVEYKALKTAVCVLQKFVDGEDIPANIENDCVGLALEEQVDKYDTRYDSAKNLFYDECATTSFQLKGFHWQESSWTPDGKLGTATAPQDDNGNAEGVWTTLPVASDYVGGTGGVWSKDAYASSPGTFDAGVLAGTCPES